MAAADSFVGEHLVPSPWKECLVELEEYKKRNELLNTLLKDQRNLTAVQTTEALTLATEVRRLESCYRQECEASANLQVKLDDLRQANTTNGTRSAVKAWREYAETLRRRLEEHFRVHRTDIMTMKANDELNLKLLEEGSLDKMKGYLTTNISLWTALLRDMTEELDHLDRYLPQPPAEP